MPVSHWVGAWLIASVTAPLPILLYALLIVGISDDSYFARSDLIPGLLRVLSGYLLIAVICAVPAGIWAVLTALVARWRGRVALVPGMLTGAAVPVALLAMIHVAFDEPWALGRDPETYIAALFAGSGMVAALAGLGPVLWWQRRRVRIGLAVFD